MFGENIELYKVILNKLDGPKPIDWIPVVLRNLPIYFDKNKIQRLLSGIPHRSEEEPIMLNEKKHGLVFFNDIESAAEAM